MVFFRVFDWAISGEGDFRIGKWIRRMTLNEQWHDVLGKGWRRKDWPLHGFCFIRVYKFKSIAHQKLPCPILFTS